MLTEDMHQALCHLICCLGFEWSQEDELAEAVLVIEDELVPVIRTQLQVDQISLPTYANPCWYDRLVNYLLVDFLPLLA